METYVADKRVIYQNQDSECWTICNADQKWGKSFAQETKARVLWYSERPLDVAIGSDALGGWLTPHDPSGCLEGHGRFVPFGPEECIVPQKILVPGLHQKKNLLMAAIALRAWGVPSAAIVNAMASFAGVPHRLEFVAEVGGVAWYNDSTATIPDAAIAAIDSFARPLILIAGGSDKMSDFSGFVQKAKSLKSLILLEGTGTDRMIPLLHANNIQYEGPFSSMHAAVSAAAQNATYGDIVLLSPGCASFGMFVHEFARGDAFKDEVAQLAAIIEK